VKPGDLVVGNREQFFNNGFWFKDMCGELIKSSFNRIFIVTGVASDHKPRYGRDDRYDKVYITDGKTVGYAYDDWLIMLDGTKTS